MVGEGTPAIGAGRARKEVVLLYKSAIGVVPLRPLPSALRNLARSQTAGQNGLLRSSFPGLMTNSFGTSPLHAAFAVPVPAHVLRKVNARAALFNLPEPSSSLLAECFRQFGIETVPVSDADSERLHKQKFDACVLPLGDSVGHIIELARSSPSNSRLVIYGLGGSAQDAMRYSKHCINAMFHEPLERSATLKLMRSTRPLVLHEFRRYARIPVMTDVTVVAADSSRFLVTSQEISAGGMSMRGTAKLEPGQLVEEVSGLRKCKAFGWMRLATPSRRDAACRVSLSHTRPSFSQHLRPRTEALFAPFRLK